MNVLRILLLAYAGYALLLFVMQRTVIYPGVELTPLRPRSQVPEGVEQVWLEASFGQVEAWLFAAGTTHVGQGGARGVASRASDVALPAPALVFAHGNGELIDHGRAELEASRDLGLHVLAVEYPGYGHSAGRPTRASIAETFTLAYDWLVARPDVDADRVVLMGRSLGSGAVGDLALARPARALVFHAPFASMARMAWDVFKVPGFLARDRFDNERVLREFEGPILLIHGKRDEVVPYRHSERLAALGGPERLSGSVELMSLDGAHNDYGRHWAEIAERIRAFLRASGVL